MNIYANILNIYDWQRLDLTPGFCMLLFLQEEIDAVDAAAVIEQCSLREAKYMLEHFINLAINKVC